MVAEVFRIHGLDPASHTPTLENALNLYHAEDRERVADIVEKAVRTGQTFEFDARIVRADGEVRHVRSRGMATADDAGNTLSLFGVFIDITDQVEAERALRAANERLEAMVHRDAMTGLANRRHFDTILEQEWQAGARAGTPLSMVMIDVDRFKSFNDRYGHQAGDHCLRAVSRAISGILLGARDESARYGGEEFALLLPGADELSSAGVAEQARSMVAALAIRHAGNPEGGGMVTISLGVATARPIKGGSMADLVREADSYLYEAKRTGRNRVVDRWSVVESEGAASDERRRLCSVRSYVDRGLSHRNAKLDRLAAAAARLLGMPIGLVTLVTEDTQVLIGNYGLEGVTQTPRGQSFCTHTILRDEPLVVLDASQDRRFDQNPLVTGDPGIRFYMGVPIASPEDGQNLGALCVIDRNPHDGIDPKAREVLCELASLVSDLIGELPRV
jgi:diguanylate cyclase (GGDEF)-like protein